MSTEAPNIAQRVTDAMITYLSQKDAYASTQPVNVAEMEMLLGELVAAIAELDARTAHVQR